VAPFDAALLASILVIATPLLIVATGELVSERAGILNVGLDGIVLTGAFAAFFVYQRTGSLVLGFGGGLGAGLLMGVAMAALAIEARADQIVSGIAINLLAVGLTSFLNDEIYGGAYKGSLPTLPDVSIPLLSKLGAVGSAIFDRDVVSYLAIVLILVVGWAVLRTPWGIALRAVGENPAAADAAGISVRAMRWVGVLTAGACAGLGGAYLSIGEVGVFRNEMTGGRGFLALAAVIFGRWSPFGVVGACLVFAFADALQLRLQGVHAIPASVWLVAAAIAVLLVVAALRRGPVRDARLGLALGVTAAAAAIVVGSAHVDLSIPPSLWLAAPFVLALGALTAAGHRRTAMPSALSVPYDREAR
jgi:simple sugar transport system permease protein